jgi:predicted phosphodiesterase
MRSYTNKNGEVIEVSQEHLDTAVRIKRELQMASPSHRCNWNLHKKMMEECGFYDSEASENYRLMIKNYQASIGQLDSKEKYADLVADSKLKAIKEAVGELSYTKREVQLENQKLNKLKRELTLYGVISEQIREAILYELNQEIPKWVYKERLPEGKRRMVVLISDWHIGSVVVNVNGNSYNFVIAKKRVNKYFEKIVEIANLYGITDVDVVCLGDMTEHVHMRKPQSFNTEFPFSVQIVKAYELIRDFLFNLSQYFNITFRGVSGNHDRMEGNKEDNIDSDSSVLIINYMIKEFIENANIPRIKYYEVDNINYSASFEVNGVKMKFVHGDNESGSNKLASHCLMDGEDYDVLVMGHLHHFSVKEVGYNKFEVYVGSLKGTDNYSKKGKHASNASQGIIIVDENGELDFKRIDLQIV